MGVKSRIGVVQTSIMIKLDTINPDHNRTGVQGTEYGRKGSAAIKRETQGSILISQVPSRP